MFFSINYRDYLQFLYAFFLTQSKQKANDMVALQVRSNQMSIRFFMKIVSTANGQNLLYQRKWLRARTAEKVHPQHTEAAACFPVTVRPWLLRFSAAWKLQSPQLISQFSGSVVSDSATPWTAACQPSLSITSSQVYPNSCPSNHLFLCHPLLLLPSIFPSIRALSNESALCIRWPKYWSFSFNISPSNEHPGLISFRMDWLDLLESKGLSRVFSNTTVQKRRFFGTQLSL